MTFLKKAVFICLIVLSGTFYSQAQTIWTGPKITFSKSAGAIWTLEGNQDRITDNVWITRANIQGLFNIAQETSMASNSPIGTEWAYGTTSDLNNLTFDTWLSTVSRPPNSVGRDMVLHLITDDIYIDIKMLDWGERENNTHFTYERSTNQNLNTNKYYSNKVKIYPNPSSNFIKISGIDNTESFYIFNILGIEILKGHISNNGLVDIEKLRPGNYFIILLNSKTYIRFVKN